jgi:hypothetical protein
MPSIKAEATTRLGTQQYGADFDARWRSPQADGPHRTKNYSIGFEHEINRSNQ